MRKSLFSLLATAMVASIVFVSCEKDEGLIVDKPIGVNKAFVDEDFPYGFLKPSALKAAGELYDEVVDFVDGSVPVFVSAPNYGTVSYDSILNHSTAGTGSVKLSPDTSDIARMWIDLATVDSLLTIQYLGSAVGQVIGIGVGNMTDNEYKFTSYIDSYLSSAEVNTWREHSYDWYSKIEQYISSDPDWGWSDDFAVVVATNDSSLYVDKYELGCPQAETPNISGASSRTVNYMMMPHQETFNVPAGADGYQWSCSTGTIVSGGTSNSCTFSFLHYSSQTHTIKCKIRDTDYCTEWSNEDTHSFTINLW